MFLEEEAGKMRELVGYCKACGREVYCNDGFFTGIVLEDKTIVCFDCADEDKGRDKERSDGREQADSGEQG